MFYKWTPFICRIRTLNFDTFSWWQPETLNHNMVENAETSCWKCFYTSTALMLPLCCAIRFFAFSKSLYKKWNWRDYGWCCISMVMEVLSKWQIVNDTKQRTQCRSLWDTLGDWNSGQFVNYKSKEITDILVYLYIMTRGLCDFFDYDKVGIYRKNKLIL